MSYVLITTAGSRFEMFYFTYITPLRDPWFARIVAGCGLSHHRRPCITLGVLSMPHLITDLTALP